MTLYNCSDRMCGAEDCSTCHPGNDNEIEHNEAQEEREIDRMDDERDRGDER